MWSKNGLFWRAITVLDQPVRRLCVCVCVMCSVTNVWVGLYRRLSGGQYEWSDNNLSPPYASFGSDIFYFSLLLPISLTTEYIDSIRIRVVRESIFFDPAQPNALTE